ncbi:MAG: DUF4418 family protein [Thermoleophilia bacterium]|nr:DUF4418 family protein [Thermoleophilia bacterium]
MSKRNSMAAGAGVAALGALVAATPRYLFPVCEYFGVRMEMQGRTDHMHCFYTARASLMIGLIIGLIGIALFLSRRPETRRLLSLVLAGSAGAVILVPTALFTVCQNPDMHCNHGTVPLLIVLGITTLLFSGWLGLTSRAPESMEEPSLAEALR